MGLVAVEALGMPLYGEKVQTGGGIGFDCFDDGILRATGDDPEAVARYRDCLMVRGVDGDADLPVGERGLRSGGRAWARTDVGAMEAVWAMATDGPAG